MQNFTWNQCLWCVCVWIYQIIRHFVFENRNICNPRNKSKREKKIVRYLIGFIFTNSDNMKVCDPMCECVFVSESVLFFGYYYCCCCFVCVCLYCENNKKKTFKNSDWIDKQHSKLMLFQHTESRILSMSDIFHACTFSSVLLFRSWIFFCSLFCTFSLSSTHS